MFEQNLTDLYETEKSLIKDKQVLIIGPMEILLRKNKSHPMNCVTLKKRFRGKPFPEMHWAIQKSEFLTGVYLQTLTCLLT